jgi:hypothetical protein
MLEDQRWRNGTTGHCCACACATLVGVAVEGDERGGGRQRVRSGGNGGGGPLDWLEKKRERDRGMACRSLA